MTRPAALALALAASTGPAPAGAQQPAAAPRPYVTYRPAYTYARPGVTPYAPVRDGRAVLPAFSARGGVGTTPYLGNTRGLGGYSVNYDAPRRPASAHPARRGWLFRRPR